METILKFNHKYEVESNSELSGNEKEKIFYFPGPSEDGGKGGLQVRVIPEEGQPWIGIFSSTFGEGAGSAGIYSCPDEETLCVIYAGAGYMGKVQEPKSWQQIPILPIKQVVADSENQIMIFADDTNLTAYGTTGELWKTRVSWDGIEIEKIENGFIVGKSYDPTMNGGANVHFIVDLKSGKLEGGSGPK